MRTTPAGPSRCSDRGRGCTVRAAIAGACLALLLARPAAAAPQDPAPPPPPPPQEPEPRPRVEKPPEAEAPAPQQVRDLELVIDERIQRLQGRTVRSIEVRQADARGGQRPMADETAESVVRSLSTRVGQPLSVRNVTLDCANLWNERRLAARAEAIEDGDQVIVRFVVMTEVQIYERVEFKGLRHFDRATLDALLGLYPDRQVTSVEAAAMRKVLLARYRREGFAFCSIDLREKDPEGGAPGDRPRKVLTMNIDEGPKVSVDSFRFRGNWSYPARPSLGLFGSGDYLLRESRIQSDPSWAFVSGEPFSREILEEDLDRLRLFLRSRGYLDATAELARVTPSEDSSKVAVEVLVVEGKRYSIASITIEHLGEDRQPLPKEKILYPPEQIAAVVKLKAGESYDHDRIARDLQAIQEFYGERGHPSRSFPGMAQIPGAFEVVKPPKERYTSDHQVHLTFQIVEGTPKRLRDVVIRGNQYTRDKVIRRRIRALPGERIDMRQVNRSIRNLEQTRYFQDLVTMEGPRYRFLPTDRTDELDLAIDVKEGETGELRWGIGISTGQGAQATIQFNKRNFDLFHTPSSANPFTAIGEVIDNRAFHGGGQQLDLLLAPGTEVSQFEIAFTEPDLFGQHFDTYELRVAGLRRIRRYRDGYTTDSLGANAGLQRYLSDHVSVGFAVRQESVEVEDLAPDAPSVAFDAEGQTELRGTRLSMRFRDFDDFRRPTSGIELGAAAELLGGILGGEESMWKLTHNANLYVPLLENVSGHRTVLHLEHAFGWAKAFGNTDDVFLTERFYMGGANLRGFDFRGAGPSQFGRAFGGEALYTATVEIGFPLVATQLEREIRDRELLRGVLFTDYGLLGLQIDDPTFSELRASYGAGIRIYVPVMEIAIQVDVAWPFFYEETDNRQQVYFSLGR